jgi:hypothetical protein
MGCPHIALFPCQWKSKKVLINVSCERMKGWKQQLKRHQQQHTQYKMHSTSHKINLEKKQLAILNMPVTV